jgi:hypothetical protein
MPCQHVVTSLQQDGEVSEPEEPPDTIQVESVAGLSPSTFPAAELETLSMAAASLEPPDDAPPHVVTDSIGSQTYGKRAVQ